MSAARMRTGPVFLCFFLFISIAGCADENPTEPTGGDARVLVPRPTFTVTTLPDELIFEDEPMIEIAKAMPTFGGFYYNDQGEIEVLLTDEADLAEVRGMIRPHIGRSRAETARFIGRPAMYSFLDLARYRTVLRQRVFDIPGVVSIGVRESANRVKIGIEGGQVEASVRELMRELGVPQPAVIFVLEARGRDMMLAHPAPEAARSWLSLTLQDQQPDGHIQGGWEIRTTQGICTLGFPALRQSDHLPIFVTNSHCTLVRTAFDGAIFRQPVGPQVGHEILDPPSYRCGTIADDCRNADAAMIQADVPIDLGRIARTTQASPIGCEHCEEPLTVDAAQPTFVIGDRIDNVFENETLNKLGRTTGWTRGNVEDTCDDFESGIPGNNDPWVKQCSDRVDFSINPGDSGSPVFSVAPNGTVELRGIAFGEQTCCLGYYDAWMSDLNQIRKDLGALIVHDPGPPGVSILGPAEVSVGVWCSWTARVVNGVPPYQYQWWGMFSGSGSSIGGFVGSGGDLFIRVTDGFGRQSTDAITVVVNGDPGPIMCE